MNANVSYRPDIDGLRALAVLSVVLFHLGVGGISGGFFGVDVFFVISGYLITAIIERELASGKFSLVRFYERRILRILPALFTVLVFATVAASVYFLPQDLIYFGQTLAATASFGSNILFWFKSGYFEPDSTYIPLLHTWSLAVEEQFYILFPLFLMALHAFRPDWRKPVILLLSLGSFGLSLFLLRSQQSFVFYNLPTRAWELLIGSILAMGYVPVAQNRKLLDALSITGLALIIMAVLVFSQWTDFPGIAALLPTMGAALILYTGQLGNVLSRRILSQKLLVFFGKISYSLYLWHWPLIVLFKYALPCDFTVGWMAVVFTLCVAVSYLSWRFIEQPARHQNALRGKKLLVVALLACFVYAGIGLFLGSGKGFPARFSPDILKLTEIQPDPSLPGIPGVEGQGYKITIGNPKARESFLVWGDSHSHAALPGIHAIATEKNRKGYLLGIHSCMPSAVDNPAMDVDCNLLNHRNLEFLKSHPDIKTVILIGRWSAYAALLEKHHISGREPRADAFNYYLGLLLDELKGRHIRVVVVAEVPVAPAENIPLYLARHIIYGDALSLSVPLAGHFKQQELVEQNFTTLKKNHDFVLLEPYKTMCAYNRCPLMGEGKSYYKDDDHISPYGSLHFKAMYAPAFQ